MMITATFVILSLANCCFFSGAQHLSWKDICHGFPVSKKGESVGCTLEHNPVCGSDGRTYGNKCLFCVARWKYGSTLMIRYKDICKEDVICDQYPPPKKGEPLICTLVFDPICGSDGQTHGNQCLFCAARRKSGGTLTIRYEGQCIEEALCSKYPEPKKGKPVVCLDIYEPICGSDGVTYGNLCYFCAAWRYSRGTLTIHHEGECIGKTYSFPGFINSGGKFFFNPNSMEQEGKF